MFVPVVQIRRVRVRVDERLMPMVMRVRLVSIPGEIVRVPVMFVVPMRVRV